MPARGPDVTPVPCVASANSLKLMSYLGRMTQMAQEPTETVREIWDLRHKQDPERVGAIISAAEFQEMRTRIARQCVPFTTLPAR